MKQLKALEILKDIQEDKEDVPFRRIVEINEAITELEVLQNRSCKNCKFEDYQAHFQPTHMCRKEKTFYCNKWEFK